MAKRELPITDYAVLWSMTGNKRQSYLGSFYTRKPKASYRPTREHAGKCFEEVTEFFTFDPLTLAEIESLILAKANVFSKDMNLGTIRALWIEARRRNIRVRRYHPPPLRVSPTRQIKGLVRFVAADEQGPFFPVIEPRMPGWDDRVWGLLASIHKQMCCVGEFENARIAIVRFPEGANDGSRTAEFVWDDALPVFSKAQIDEAIEEIDRLHDWLRPWETAGKKPRYPDEDGQQGDFFAGK